MRKKFHIIALASVLLYGFTGTATGQGQKLGYVNTDLIIQQMPGYEGIKQKMQQLSTNWKTTLEEMQLSIDKLQAEFKAKELLFTDEIKAQKRQQIQDKINERKQFLEQKFGPEGEYFMMQKKLLKPIQQKIYGAIIAVSQRLDIDFVFDRAQNSTLLYAGQEWNLNKEILTELGITLNQ